MSQQSLTVDLATKPAKVHRILVDGLARTKDDIVVKQLNGVFKADTFQDMLLRCMEAKLKLNQLGIFKGVDITIDTCKVPGASFDSYDVKYRVVESNFVAGGVRTEVGTNDANMRFNIRIPNLFGRAEKLLSEYTYGTKQSRGIGVTLTKPVNGNIDVILGVSGYQSHSEYPWSGFKEMDRGTSIDLSFPTILGQHDLKWEGVWRDLRCLSNTTSFAVREQAGHSLKSSIKHTYVRDSRDDIILPNMGTMFKLSQEYAGIGGTAQFIKGDVEFQVNKSLVFDTVVQLSLAGGIMKSLDKNKEILINDKFFLGGPLTLRGFNLKGVGPNSHGNALGADTYCMGAIHLYTPLPFRPGIGGFGDLFRSHFFVNAGNCGNIQNINLNQRWENNAKLFKDSLRLSYGTGLVLRLGGFARLELNYVWPLWLLQGDSANPGLQLGVGVSFL